ncbi:MAG TPA: prepilin-type N-terminal cleavage/methylation domain-containing protein [Thermoanaerobaculia bacterium]|jgi:prepilin-type N-terminal cleavage/methylation domain-containing protein
MRPLSSRRRQAGFTIVEMMIALVLLLVGLMIAADLLMESSRLFVETAGEALDNPAPLAAARMRADIQGSTSVTPLLSPLDNRTLIGVDVQGGSQEIVYQKIGDVIYRSIVLFPGSPPQDPAPLWRGVTSWSCEAGSKDEPVILAITYSRRTTPHTPLPVLPADRGPLQEEVQEILYVLPRGDGW